VRALLAGDWRVTGAFSKLRTAYVGCGCGWLASDWLLTGGVLNITAVAWTAGFHWWRSGNITRTQNVSEYMLVLALCLVLMAIIYRTAYATPNVFSCQFSSAALFQSAVDAS